MSAYTKTQLYQERMARQGQQYGLNQLYGLQQLARDCWDKSSTIAEVGSFNGVSTRLLAELCGTVISVEPHVRPLLSVVEAEYANVRVINAMSTAAAKSVPDGSLDGVYIDADHTTLPVIDDIRAWWPKVKEGGYVAGHDYVGDNLRNLPAVPACGVKAAVDQLLYNRHIVYYPDTSWAVRKLGELHAPRHAVVTLAVGDEALQMLEITGPYMQAYADRVGAKFHVIEKGVQTSGHVMFEKFQVGALLRIYDRVFYVDADAIVHSDCPNVFEEVPATHIGAFMESNYMDHTQTIVYAQHVLGSIDWMTGYFNAGVLVVSAQHRSIFNMPLVPCVKYGDQTQLNYNVQSARYPIHQLPGSFNFQFRNKRLQRSYSELDSLTADNKESAYVLHYSDFPKGAKRLAELQAYAPPNPTNNMVNVI